MITNRRLFFLLVVFLVTSLIVEPDIVTKNKNITCYIIGIENYGFVVKSITHVCKEFNHLTVNLYRNFYFLNQFLCDSS